MWEPDGTAIDTATLGELRPEEVLLEFEEPLTFTCRDRDGQMLLAHSLCSKGGLSRYLMVPTDQETIDGLKAGRLEILAASRQVCCWLSDFGPGWEIRRLWEIPFEKIPTGLLPEPNATLVME